ncbi:MAG: LytTR family DNA-binding domain-containing protein [Schleiferiaceae bacterium]|nr:LytTR family DNA-binding domain-containing protein [Schleiferiaceae bacterium]MDR9441358.1 LytTR family DNA-binding domain-containing protein [Schleiferiaceae bacterium]
MKAIIIDDEQHCSESLRLLIEQETPQVEVLAEANDPFQGLGLVTAHQPDLLFLDVEMPHMSGFELLAQLKDLSFETIFTTAYDEFAVKAFKYNAIDYLLKPIAEEELRQAVDKAGQKLKSDDYQFKFHAMLNQMGHGKESEGKISLPTMEGLEFVKVQDIIRCQSDSNYTELTLTSGRKVVVSKTLKEIQELLPERTFVRVHHSHVINLNHITRYQRGAGGVLIMDNDEHVNVSRSRKEAFLRSL